MTTPFEQAKAGQIMWKPGAILGAAVQLIRAGLSELDKGRSYFGPDNVSEDYEYNGQGAAGTTIRLMLDDNQIKHSDLHRPDVGIVHGRRKSLRPSAHGRRVDLYELCGRAKAEAFLVRFDPTWKREQRDWVDEVKTTGKVDGNFVSVAEAEKVQR